MGNFVRKRSLGYGVIMKKSKKFFPFLDGFIYACIFSFVFNLPLLSQCFDYESYYANLFISIIFALISSSIFLILQHSEYSNKKLASFTIKSLCSCVFCVTCWIIIKIYFPIIVLPLKNTNIVYGIMALFNLRYFLIVSLVSRIFILILLAIRNKRKRQMMQRDGSSVSSR